MCLSRISKRKIAWKPITVYKVIVERGGTYITPFQITEIKLKKTYKSKIYKEFDYNNSIKIEKGLHSFKTLEGTMIFEPCIFGLKRIVKCRIPRFSIYYEGWFLGEKSIASNKLRYLEIVK